MNDREKIREIVFDNVDDRLIMPIPPLFIPMPRTREFCEDLRLIEDLEMDSADIYELLCNSCFELGITEPNFDNNHFETLGDVIDAIEKKLT